MKRLALIAILGFLFASFGITGFAKSIEECSKECAGKANVEQSSNQDCVCECLHKSCMEKCDVGPASEACKQKCYEGQNSCVSDESKAEMPAKPDGEEDLPEDTKKIIEQQVKEKLQIEEPKNPLKVDTPENPVEVEVEF